MAIKEVVVDKATKKPTGLTITRNGMNFTFEWKIGDANYDAGQYLAYCTNYLPPKKGSPGQAFWTNVSVGIKTTKKTITLPASSYMPTTTKQLLNVAFRVVGHRKNYTETKDNKRTKYQFSRSDEVVKVFDLTKPDKPSLTATLSDSYTNVCNFEWSLNNNIASHKAVTRFEWQSYLEKECMVSAATGTKAALSWMGSALGWQSGTSAAASGETGSNVNITEDSALLAQTSYTRWFRVRAVGAGGAGDWQYSKHVYARPFKAIIASASSALTASSTTVLATWTAKTDVAHPIDSTTVEYLIDTPNADLAPPANGSWAEGETIRDTTAKDSAKFTISSLVGTDQVLWVRVATIHDRETVYSDPYVVRCGSLADLNDNDFSVSLNQTTRVVTIGITNNSNVPDSRVAVIYRHTGRKNQTIGVIAHGDTSGSFKCPQWSDVNKVSFCVYAFQGDVTDKYDSSTGIHSIEVDANMTSNKLYYTSDLLPTEPTNVVVKLADTPKEVILTWKNSWKYATGIEISWSKNKNAWESNNGPQRYNVDNIDTPRWRISDLQLGQRWYFRLRFTQGDIFSPYSDLVSINLSTTPQMPALALSSAVVARNSSFTASWAYITDDDTDQAHAEVREVTVSGSTVTYGRKIASTETEQSVLISPRSLGWATGSTHSLAVRVTSASGRDSNWSRPVSIKVANAITCTITQTSLTDVQVVTDFNPATTYTAVTGDFDDLVINPDKFAEKFDYVAGTYTFSVEDGEWSYNGTPIDADYYGIYTETTSGTVAITLTIDPSTATEKALTVMPLTATIAGAGAGGTTTLILERAEDYHMERPDGEPMDGYAGETVAIIRQMGEAQISVSDLIGVLDDGAYYNLIAITEDGYGQSATKSIRFIVRWSHQAVMPEGSVSRNGLVTIIRPVAPTGYASGDTCDIYRLSADKPELIYKAATFGEVYVDPYPAIGENVGHRLVFMTQNGDYITADNHSAWLDFVDDAVIDEYSLIVDFGGRQVILPYNINLSNRWTKDFKSTKYLGGAVQGDWNPAVMRTATYTTDLISDDATIRAVRELADYHGICHIRTPEGSSYNANVDVAESVAYSTGGKVSYTLTATRVDPEELDGMTYDEWSGR